MMIGEGEGGEDERNNGRCQIPAPSNLLATATAADPWVLGSTFVIRRQDHFLRAKKWSPGGSVRRARVAWGVSPGGSGHQNGRFVEAKRTFFFIKKTTTVLSTDRLVALPGRSNFTPRLRGQVNLRGAGGGSKSATVPYGIVVF